MELVGHENDQNSVDVGSSESELEEDGGQQYVWSEQASRRMLKLFNNCGGPTARGERRDKTALEYFELVFDQNVWNLLVAITNVNAQRRRAGRADGGTWKDVTVQEMKYFFGLNIAMGIFKMPETTMYWQKKWSFAQVMSRNRFFQTLRYLHVSDDAVIIPAGQPRYDKLHKIKPFLGLLFLNFEMAYNLLP